MNPYLNISLPYFLNINPPPFSRSGIKKYFEKLPKGYSILAAFAAYRVLQDLDADVLLKAERDLIEQSWLYIHNKIGENEFLNLRNAFIGEDVPLGLRIANLVTGKGHINIPGVVRKGRGRVPVNTPAGAASIVVFAAGDARLTKELFEDSAVSNFYDLWWKKFIYLLNQEYFELMAVGLI